MASPYGLIPIELFEAGQSPAVIATFACLSVHADGKERIAFPSLERLSKMLGRTVRDVRRNLRALEEIGAITSVPRFDEHGRQTSNAYRLDLLIAGFATAGCHW
jgi:hypothetical protein